VRSGSALLAALVLLAALAAPAGADPGALLTINDDAEVWLSKADIDAWKDVTPAVDVVVKSPTREDHETVEGTSIANVLEAAGIPKESVTRLTVQRTAFPGVAELFGDDVVDGFTGQGARRFATVLTNHSGLGFIRPQRTAGDENYQDEITTDTSEDLQVGVETTEGSRLQLTATVDRSTIKAGDTAGFNVHVQNPPADPHLRYTWRFDDGTTGSQQAPSHTFDDAGLYAVKVTVIDTVDHSYGVGTTTVRVDAKSGATASPTPTPTATPTATPAPTRGGAKHNGPTGNGNGKKNDRPTGPADSHAHGETHRAGETSTAPPAATPTPAATPAVTPAAAKGVKRQGLPAVPGGEGEHVEGLLLASAGVDADVLAAIRSAKEDRAPGRPGGGAGASVAGWAGGGALLIALLMTGAIREGAFRRRAW
jgi:hypothetical protein